ncbi:hypothetical protein [Roseateles sp.]|uniref:hypothetical protein n=1 Tax=Roseateles sp. TaxID=1971397 RepID=UPI002DFE0A18|nr:hypothetical protein [Roseateles sp.]
MSLLPGELRPMRKSKKVYEPALAQAVRSIFRMEEGDWFVWPTANVDMEKAPIEGAARYVYTGDGVPKLTTRALGLPVSAIGTPAAARTLGIPKPQVAPGVAHSGGSGAATSRFYVYTFVSDLIEEGAESPVSAFVTGKVDGTWAITGMDSAPANSGNVTAASHSGGVVTVTLDAGRHYLRAGDEFTISSVAGMTDLNGAWVVASVPAPNQVTVALTTAQTYTSGGTWARTYPWGPCTKAIYRSTGTAGQFQLVATGVTGTSYNDTLSDAAIPGDDLISQAWAPPPVDMVGLVAMPNGVMAGFIPGGRTVCFSEPFQPHAWPEAYQKKTNDNVVGIAAFDSNLAVATVGYPVVYSGTEPAQMTPVRHRKPFPCLSRESVCSTADGVVFATRSGLARVDLAQAGIMTDALFTPEGWNALIPSTMKAAFDGQRLFVHTETASRIYILDLVNGNAMVNAYQPADCVIADASTGDFYFAFRRSVYLFDAFDTAPLSTDWWSKEYLLPKPINIGAAKVEFDEAYSAQALVALQAERDAAIAANLALMLEPQGGRGGINTSVFNFGAINDSVLEPLPDVAIKVGFSFYANGVLIFDAQIPNQAPFNLPQGYRSDVFSVRIQANTQVKAIVLAQTLKGLESA